jgi:hypothetical protein
MKTQTEVSIWVGIIALVNVIDYLRHVLHIESIRSVPIGWFWYTFSASIIFFCIVWGTVGLLYYFIGRKLEVEKTKFSPVVKYLTALPGLFISFGCFKYVGPVLITVFVPEMKNSISFSVGQIQYLIVTGIFTILWIIVHSIGWFLHRRIQAKQNSTS